MTKIKSAVDIASEATSAVGWTDSYSAIFHAEKVIREDRLSHKEAIVVALEGMKVCTPAGKADPAYYHCENTRDGTLDQAIAIVNSIYKDDNK